MTSPAQQPVARTREFRPPLCPNPDCTFHHPKRTWHWIKNGFYRRPSDQARIQCFECKHCGRRFSTSTFSTRYWLRHRSLLAKIAALAVEGPALRQTARLLGTTHATVARHIARAARHCLLYHHHLMRPFPISEPIVVDGFETFEFSQYFPFHINLAVGSNSWMIYHFTDSPLRRKGRMTDYQRRRRAELEALYGRPDPKAVELGMTALFKEVIGKVPKDQVLELHSDDHKAYPPALRRARRQVPEMPKIIHRITSSKARRTKGNPLFPANLTDLLLRHGSANHRRETISFSRRRQAAMERVALLTVWRNYIKKQRENGPRESAAMVAGLLDRLLTWRQVLSKRLFPAHADLTEEWVGYYWRKVKTKVYGARQHTHQLKYAI